MRQRQLGNWLRVRNFLVTFNLCRYIYIYIYTLCAHFINIIVSPLRSCPTVGARLSLTLSYYHVVIYYIWCLIHVHGQWLIEFIFFMLLGLFWSNRCPKKRLKFSRESLEMVWFEGVVRRLPAKKKKKYGVLINSRHKLTRCMKIEIKRKIYKN